MSKPSIKLEVAKQALAFPNFDSDELLVIVLTDPCTLNEMDLSRPEQKQREREYRRLAYLGDALIDSALADYLYSTGHDLTKADFDRWRQAIVGKHGLTGFAITLGLPDCSSSWNRKNRKAPEDEPRTWGEMFESLVGALFLDADRDFGRVSQWLCDRFLRDAIANYEEDPTLVAGDEGADMLALPDSFGVLFSTSDGD